jgi:hypothetical protein
MIRATVKLLTQVGEYHPEVAATKPFFIEPLPQAPHLEDMFDLTSITDGLPVTLSNMLLEMKWMVHMVEWKKDHSGYFILLSLMGG